MDYQRIHDNIIEKAKAEKRIKLKRCDKDYIYYENHHILPKCLGGNNKKNNLVLLTAKEHYVVHKLLVCIYPKEKGIVYALHLMTFANKRKYILSSRDYEYARDLFSLNNSGRNHMMHGKRHRISSKEKISKSLKGRKAWNKGKKCPQLSTMKGKFHTTEAKNKISLATKGKNNPFYNKLHSKETRMKMKISGQQRNNDSYRTKEYREKRSKLAKGENNGMYKVSLMDKWIEKYGVDKANERYILWKANLKKAKQK